MNSFVKNVAEKFIGTSESIISIEEYGEGIIHQTFLVNLGTPKKKFILQQLNSRVFPEPEKIMHNLKIVTRHVQQRQKIMGADIEAKWQMLQMLLTTEGKDCFVDPGGDYWRALRFISSARPLNYISGPDDAREVGRAIGTFHLLTSDLEPGLLQQTLPGFHDMAYYLKQYDEVEGRYDSGIMPEYGRDFIALRRDWALVLEMARRAQKIGLRIIHGDPKINNIMVDRSSGRAVSLIDLDTVMPGPVLYDIGDSLRSCCNISGENAEDPGKVRFDLMRCGGFLTGYSEAAGQLLTAGDFEFLYDAIRLVPFELGLRFFTDFLTGDIYFKVKSREQNLKRASVQFRLVESIEQQENELRALIAKCRDKLIQ